MSVILFKVPVVSVDGVGVGVVVGGLSLVGELSFVHPSIENNKKQAHVNRKNEKRKFLIGLVLKVQKIKLLLLNGATAIGRSYDHKIILIFNMLQEVAISENTYD